MAHSCLTRPQASSSLNLIDQTFGCGPFEFNLIQFPLIKITDPPTLSASTACSDNVLYFDVCVPWPEIGGGGGGIVGLRRGSCWLDFLESRWKTNLSFYCIWSVSSSDFCAFRFITVNLWSTHDSMIEVTAEVSESPWLWPLSLFQSHQWLWLLWAQW